MTLTQEQFTKQAIFQLIPFIEENEALPHGTIYAIHDEYLIAAQTEDFDPGNLQVIKYGNLKEKVENSEDDIQKPTIEQIIIQFESILKNPRFICVIPMSELTYAVKNKLELTKEYRNKSRTDCLRLITAYGKNDNI
jgi:hypothetical protein